jgi:dethiobiotin synthetase
MNHPLFQLNLRLRKPGLFVTATDTGVGKTVVTCGIAWHLQNKRRRVGVCKPLASGCRLDREGLVSEDAEAISHFAQCTQPLEVVNPVRYQLPLAPAVAAETSGVDADWDLVARALMRLDENNDVMLIEGVGGLMAPIDARDPKLTVLDLAAWIGYPVVVVTRPLLGTLSHTAMTVTLLRQRGLEVAGLVINNYIADSARLGDISADLSMASNPRWLAKMNGVSVLATCPACPGNEVAPHRGLLPAAILDALAMTYWPDVAGPSLGSR